MKTFRLLGCKRVKYRKYKHDLNVTLIGTRKCVGPFKLWANMSPMEKGGC